MPFTREKALELQRRMRPYAEKAEEEAKEMYENLFGELPKVYETIPPDSFENKVKIFVYWLIEP